MMGHQITVQELQRALGGVISRGKSGPQVLFGRPAAKRRLLNEMVPDKPAAVPQIRSH